MSIENKERMKAAMYEHIKKYPHNILISPSSASTYFLDPFYWVFKFSRYKHVSRLLEGKELVLEIGCGDGLASPIVASNVEHLICVDFLPELIDYAKKNIQPVHVNAHFFLHDIIKDCAPLSLIKAINDTKLVYDAVFCLDVFEHIKPDEVTYFLNGILNSIGPNGVAIIGIPSLESQEYASAMSKIGHVNCMSKKQLFNQLKSYFSNVFIFGINDETLHTGYGSMCHYLLALCTGPVIR